MPKSIIVLFGVLFFNVVHAEQQQDTVVYYLKNNGRVVSTKDSADYFRVVLPPDTTVDTELFRVNEFYPNGRRKLITGGTSNHLTLRFKGPFVNYFPNGHKMLVGTFDNSRATGDLTAFYPNGKVYSVKSYAPDGSYTLKDCHDSTGTTLAENGNGKWIEFLDGSFRSYYIAGSVVNGKEDGTWRGQKNDTVNMVWEYRDGSRVSAKDYDSMGNDITAKGEFKPVEIVPEFPGGMEKMFLFINRNLRYPGKARENNTQGKVIMSFVVEHDGSLTDIKVVKGIGDGCDEEAARIIKSFPKWTPGQQGGKPVRVQFSVPISFTLSN